ncbi:MAG: DNA polymerase II [Rickettsiales bacterium]|nr:DNA polymerase II [Rickettsiales bacterium]
MTEAQIIENKNRSEAEDASIAVAEASRELDWKSKSYMASIFMGELDQSMILPFPEQDQADRLIGDEICEKVRAWAEENLDGEAIDRDQRIPAHVFKGLNELGLWGIKIPKEYGGLGLSQTNYMRVLSVICHYCSSTAATLSGHQSIGVPQPLKLFGTEAQKQKYMPMLANGAVSAFALTEPEVGSDPANMSTTATLSEDGKTWTLNGYKLWCTNGNFADLLVVMAKTGVDKRGSREVNRISAFIVETKDPGIEVLHRCNFQGLRGIENGILRFTDVKVPAENLLWGEGKGLRLALTTLNDGRLGIPAMAAANGISASHEVARWAKSRHQWGKVIGKHEAGAEMLARITSTSYAMDTIARYGAALSDQGDTDIRMEAAAAKLFNSERGWEVADLVMQLRGGRGYETADSLQRRGEQPIPVERSMRDSRINRIVEGTTQIMHLFLAREALDKHLRMAGALFDPRSSLSAKLATVAKCGLFYSIWYPKLLLGGLLRSFARFSGPLRAEMRWIDSRCRKLARMLFHQMLFQGPKLEMRQLILARVVDVGTELAVMALVAARAQTELRAGRNEDLNTALHYLKESRVRVDSRMRAISHNNDKAASALARELMDRVEPFPPVASLDELPAMQREFGTDLTSGRRTERIELNQPLVAAKQEAPDADRVA